MDFTNYIYLPIDVDCPPVDRAKILRWHDSRKKRCMDPDISELEYPWAISKPRLRENGSTPGYIPGSSWDPSFEEEFPEIVSTVEQQLPFKEIVRVSVLEQLMEVRRHQDISRDPSPHLEPASYRCTLVNDEPEKTFYLRRGVRRLGTLEEKDLFPRLPSSTQWWVMGNLKSMHGSHMPSPGARKLIFSIWGVVDPERHFQLLQRSLSKFSEFAIRYQENDSLIGPSPSLDQGMR